MPTTKLQIRVVLLHTEAGLVFVQSFFSQLYLKQSHFIYKCSRRPPKSDLVRFKKKRKCHP